MSKKKYDLGVDYQLLSSAGVSCVKHQPWQLGLFHEELEGKFLWYPKSGTLIFENADKRYQRIGQKGDYCGTRKGSTEEVHAHILRVVEAQQT